MASRRRRSGGLTVGCGARRPATCWSPKLVAWVRGNVSRPSPRPRPGPGILAVRVGRGQAIDITATASAMAGLTAVRSTASTLEAEGVDLLLPASSYGAATVVGAWRWRRDTWQSVDPPARRLSAWTDSWPDASPRSM